LVASEATAIDATSASVVRAGWRRRGRRVTRAGAMMMMMMMMMMMKMASTRER